MATQEEGRRFEVLGLVRPEVTPDSLRRYNLSDETRTINKEWQKNKDENNLWIIVTCGDARLLIPNPEKTIFIRSIAGGGIKEKDIFLKGGAKFAVAIGHFGHFTLGKMTEGCGGAAAKIDSMNNHSHIKIPRLQRYVDKEIDYPDVLVQAIRNAKRIFKETGLPSIAVGQNHRTGETYPLAVFTKEISEVQQKFDLEELFTKYNEAEIYAEGIPTLPEFAIPAMFREYLDASNKYMETMLRKYPNLEELQETQNPKIIGITTKLNSFLTRYAQLDAPNSIFELHLPREKNDDGETKINPEAQKSVIAQALYPITNAVDNYKKTNASFSDTDTIMIETSSMANSINFAEELMEESEARKWIALDNNHKIIVIQNKVGISNKVDDYIPNQPKIPGLA